MRAAAGIAVRNRPGNQSRTITETFWVARDLGGVVLKYTDGEVTVQFERVEPGPQNPGLFDVPGLSPSRRDAR